MLGDNMPCSAAVYAEVEREYKHDDNTDDKTEHRGYCSDGSRAEQAAKSAGRCHYQYAEPVVKAQTYRKTSERCKAGGKSEDSAVYAAYLIYRSNELTAIQRLYDLAVVMCTYFVRVINAEPADNRNYCNCDQRHP